MLQTYAVNRTWFYKKDLEPLEELERHSISFTIYNFDPYSYDYKLTISAHVTAPQFGLYDVFIDYSFWNNKRIHLIQPTSIIFTPNYLLMTSDFYSGYKPLLSEPVLVGLNPTPLNNYTDNLLTNNVLFFNTLGESFPCSLNNNAWFLNGFFQNPQNQIILEQIYHSISNGGVGAFVIQMKGGVDGDPVQSFHIPVLWKDNL